MSASQLDEADWAALNFLGEHGPHTMGPVLTGEQLAAAFYFARLEAKGLVSLNDWGGGVFQAAITDKGRELRGEA